MKQNKYIIVYVIGLISFNSFSANISISGPTSVCPSVEYSYTATASNVFGSVNGIFEWGFKESNNWQFVGSLSCPVPSSGPGISSSSTISWTWGTANPQEIRVRFIPAGNPFCPISSKTISITTALVPPGLPRDSDGGLGFCGSSQTKTITIPGIPWLNPNTCNWHHKYDWIVPQGWTVTPANGENYTTIQGGIRSFATSVNITTSSGSLLPGYTGNYFITVRTEPAWPWLMESTRQVWIGAPETPGYIIGDTSPGVGTINLYRTHSPSVGSTSYNWILPYCYSCNTPWSGSSTTSQIFAYVGDPAGYVQAIGVNSCGNSGASLLWVQPEQGGGGVIQSYPNPADEELNISLESSDESEAKHDVTLLNSQQKAVFRHQFYSNQFKIDTKHFQNGVYYLHIINDMGFFKKRIVIHH
jgi:hypothetical protein